MKIVEWRVILPMTVEQFKRSEKYSIARRTLDDADEKGGVERVMTDVRQWNGREACYTKLFYRYKKRIPTFMKLVIPNNFTELIEEVYDQFPVKTSVFSIQDRPKTLDMTVTTHVSEYTGENQIFDDTDVYSQEEIAHREIYYLDVVNTKSAKSDDYKIDGFECPEANIGKLTANGRADKNKVPEWTKNYNGPMCIARKIIRVKVSIFGLSSLAEELVSHTLLPGLYADLHKGMIYWSKSWNAMNFQQILAYETDIANRIKNMLIENHCI